MNTRWSMPCLLLVLAACHPSADEPPDQPAEPAAGEAEAAPLDEAATDDAIAALLRARHTEDLPSAEQLAKYPEAEATLRRLAAAGETMMIRTRALSLLRHYGSAETGTLLTSVVGDDSAHPALRAAALTGLAGQPPDRRLELGGAALRDDDPRVGRAAVELLTGFEAGRELLDEARGDETVPASTRAAIDSSR